MLHQKTAGLRTEALFESLIFIIMTLKEAEAGKKRKCYNCLHRTEAFKVGKLTHYHCMSPTYTKQHNEGIDISPWETLRVFSDNCDEHEFR